MSKPDATDETGSAASLSDQKNRARLRWIIGGLAAGSGATLAIASYWYSPIRICRGVSECTPWSLVELTPFLVIALIAILPDLSEMTIGNVVSLKRRIEIQQGEIDLTTKRQEAIERQVSQLTNVSTSQHLTQQFFNLPAGSAAHLSDAVNKKKERLKDAAQHVSVNPDGDNRVPPIRLPGEVYISDYPPEDAQRALQLIEQWEELSRFLTPRFPFDLGELSDMEQLLRRARRNFSHLFAEEIDAVRSVRNSIAHARYVPAEDLRGALEAAQELNRILADTKGADLADL
jgi:hypothetical protein